MTSSFPLVIAHRGASAERPENTLGAFEAAADAGADMVELDVRLTADGVAVVLHDPDLGTTTDRGGLVHTLPLAEVKRADASRGLGPRQEVPTLAEALSLLDRLGLGVDIEVKNIPGEPAYDSPREATLEATLKTLGAASFVGPVILSSFNPMTLERCRAMAPELTTGLLTIVDPREVLVSVARTGHRWVLPVAARVLDAGPAIVAEARREGLSVGTWTVDDEDDLRRLFSWGLGAVATNDPRTAVRVRRSVLG